MKKIVVGLVGAVLIGAVIFMAARASDWAVPSLPHTVFAEGRRQVAATIVALPAGEEADSASVEDSGSLRIVPVHVEGFSGTYYAVFPDRCGTDAAVGSIVTVDILPLNAEGTLIVEHPEKTHQAHIWAIKCP